MIDLPEGGLGENRSGPELGLREERPLDPVDEADPSLGCAVVPATPAAAVVLEGGLWGAKEELLSILLRSDSSAMIMEEACAAAAAAALAALAAMVTLMAAASAAAGGVLGRTAAALLRADCGREEGREPEAELLRTGKLPGANVSIATGAGSSSGSQPRSSMRPEASTASPGSLCRKLNCRGGGAVASGEKLDELGARKKESK